MDSSEIITIIFADMAADARIALYGNLRDLIGLQKLTPEQQFTKCLEWGANNAVEFLILAKPPEYGLPIYGLRTDPLTLLKLL